MRNLNPIERGALTDCEKTVLETRILTMLDAAPQARLLSKSFKTCLIETRAGAQSLAYSADQVEKALRRLEIARRVQRIVGIHVRWQSLPRIEHQLPISIRIFEVLTRPMTSLEVADLLRENPKVVANALRRLLKKNTVVRDTAGLWSIA